MQWLWRVAAAAAVILCPSLALAQGSTVYQNGTAVANHIAKFVTNGRIADVGGILGDANGLGVSPFGITDGNGPGVCTYNGLTTSGTARGLCLGHTAQGDALIEVSGGGSLDITVNGSNLPVPGAISGLPTVADNTALGAQPHTFAALVVRQDHTLGLGAPPTFYTSSAAACSLNAGNGDGGAQVKSADAGCWLLAKGQRAVPQIWGVRGDGTDPGSLNAGRLNAAAAYVASLGGGKLYGLLGSNYAINATFQLPESVWFVGAGWDNGTKITALAAMDPVVKLTRRSGLEDLLVTATAAPLGRVVQVGDDLNSFRVSLRRVYTSGGCIGLDITGPSHSVQESFFYDMAAGVNCGGVRVGHGTTGGQTSDLKLLNVTSACTPGAVANYNFLIEDSGGLFLGPGTDGVNCTYGTIMRPQANQQVALTYCNDSAIGDTNVLAGLLIDTGSASGQVRGNMFVQCWTSAATDSGAGAGIVIQNSAGGIIAGNTFIGHRIYIPFKVGVAMKTPAAGSITDTVFDGLRVCGVQTGGVDFDLAANLGVTIRNSRLGKDCDGQTAGAVNPIYGLGMGGNNAVILTNNDFSGVATAVSGVAVGNSIVANNTVDVTPGPSYTAASTVTLNQMSKRIHLTAAGAATVNTITPAWNGQELCIIGENAAGAITFGTSGNIRYAATISTGGGMLCGYYDATFSKWVLH